MTLGVWEEVADQDELDLYTSQVQAREARIKNYTGTRAIVPVAPVQDRPRGVVSRKWEGRRVGDKITLSQTTHITHPSGGYEFERETVRKTVVGTFTLSPRQPGVNPCILRFSLTQDRKGGNATITPTDDAQLSWDGDAECPIAIGVNTSPLRVQPVLKGLDARNARVNGDRVNVLNEDNPKKIPSDLPCKNAALRVVLASDQTVTVGWLLVGRIEARPHHAGFKTRWVEGEADIASVSSGDVMIGGKIPNCWHFAGKGQFTL